MAYNWINPKNHSVKAIFLMDKWIIEHLLGIENPEGLFSDEEYRYHLSIILKQNPDIAWYITHKSQKTQTTVEKLLSQAPIYINKDMEINSQATFLSMIETYLVYVYPSTMAELDYIKHWNENKLLELTNFKGKVVLDIGSGTGRLAFAAAKHAKHVYAIEPVDELRNYIRSVCLDKNITNITVIDGTIEHIPYPDNTFDIVMSAHVMGDNYDTEYKEMCRVTKKPGILIDCAGEDGLDRSHHQSELKRLGFTLKAYQDAQGITVPRAIKYIK